MLRFVWFLAFALIEFAAGPQADAAPQVSIAPTLPLSMYSTRINNCGGFAEDELNLAVSDHGKQVASDTICSSYGRAAAHVVTDKLNKTFILLEYTLGRGTNAWTDYLELDRLERPVLLEVVRVPLSWGAGPSLRFTYSYIVELPASEGVRIHLKRQNIGQPSSDLGCCVPDARNLTIDVSR